uniref:Uncharacterized protein n=1 Tax=Lepeophtheirus salmonis TaxID=72036 RepID=A0A0K2UP65_LEPSM
MMMTTTALKIFYYKLIRPFLNLRLRVRLMIIIHPMEGAMKSILSKFHFFKQVNDIHINYHNNYLTIYKYCNIAIRKDEILLKNKIDKQNNGFTQELT